MPGHTGETASAPLTVVIPVWNEGENLRAWWRAAAPHLPAGTQVLVVHDTADDDTLPVVEALAREGAPIRPLRSRGAGFPDAMLTGLGEPASGPVLVAMADLSDDLGALPRMLDAYRAGAELVVGSRYMPGGCQEGAHPAKAFLARWGSRLLHQVAHLPVRDASNAFRLYDAGLVARLRIEPAAGFEVVLALLLAAWESGARIVEVPVSWQARSRGQSRFRFRWLPRYARLWTRALRYGLSRRVAPREAR